MSTQPFISTYAAEEIHQKDIYGVQCTNKYTYAASGDGTISMWSNMKVSMEPTFLHTEEIKTGVHHISAGNDGQYLVAIAFDGLIYAFDLKTQKLIDLNSTNCIKGAWAVCTYGSKAVISTLAGNIYIVDLDSNEILFDLPEPSGTKQPCVSLDVTAGGNLLVAGYNNGKVRVFNLETKRVAYTLPSHISPPRKVKFSHDGETIAVGGEDSIALFTLNGGTYLGSLVGHEACVYDLDFDPTTDRLLSVSGDGKAKLWSLDTKTCVLTLNDTEAPLFACAWCEPRANIIGGAPSGFATAGVDGTIRWYREASGNNNDI